MRYNGGAMKQNLVQKNLGKKLIQLRNEQGKSEKEIASVMGITKRKYSKIEQGKAVFYLRQGIALAEYYQISLDFFAKD